MYVRTYRQTGQTHNPPFRSQLVKNIYMHTQSNFRNYIVVRQQNTYRCLASQVQAAVYAAAAACRRACLEHTRIGSMPSPASYRQAGAEPRRLDRQSEAYVGAATRSTCCYIKYLYYISLTKNIWNDISSRRPERRTFC